MSKFLLKNEKGVEGLVNDEQYRESVITVHIPNISAVTTRYLHLPKCKIVCAYAVIAGAIADADATIKLYKNGQIMTNGTMTIAFAGSGVGSIFSCTPTAYNELCCTDYLKVVGGGESTNAVICQVTVQFLQKP